MLLLLGIPPKLMSPMSLYFLETSTIWPALYLSHTQRKAITLIISTNYNINKTCLSPRLHRKHNRTFSKMLAVSRAATFEGCKQSCRRTLGALRIFLQISVEFFRKQAALECSCLYSHVGRLHIIYHFFEKKSLRKACLGQSYIADA